MIVCDWFEVFVARTLTNILSVVLIENPPWNPSDNTIDGFGEFAVTGAGSVENNKVSDAKTKADAEEVKKSTDANIELTKKEGGWKTYDELIASDTKENIMNPLMYEKKIVDGIALYRRTSGKGITGGLDERQQKVVDKWKSQGAKLENEVDAEQAKTWTRKMVSPKSEGLFSEDFYMYFPPSTITNTEITSAFADAVRDQTPESSEDCKKTIEAYYMAFKKKKKIVKNQ